MPAKLTARQGKKMRVVMTLLVRNEEDILDYHLRYHLTQGIDFFIVTDHRSEDATRAVLERYQRLGVLHVIDQPDDNFAQSRWVTHMARLAARALDADWVIHADADEFFFARDGTVRDALAAVPDEFGIVSMRRLNFRARPENGEPFYERMLVRDARPLPNLAPHVCHRAHSRALVTDGNHRVKRTRLRELPAEPIGFFHYSIRSYAQFERKVRLGGAAIMRNPALGPGKATHWRAWYELLLAGDLRTYYDTQIVDEERLAEGLRSGELVVDRHLSRVLAELPSEVEVVALSRRRGWDRSPEGLRRGKTLAERANDRAVGAFWGLVGRFPVVRGLLIRVKHGVNRLRTSGRRLVARR